MSYLTRALAVPASLIIVLWQVGCSPGGARQLPAAENTPPAAPASEVAAGAGQSSRSEAHDARWYFERGRELYRDDRDAEAAEAFRQAVSLDPGMAEAHYRLGLVLASLGEDEGAEEAFGKAARAFRKVISRRPKDAEAYYLSGLAHSRLHKYGEAVRDYKKAVDLDPKDGDKYYELGLAHGRLAQYEEAVKAHRRAVGIDPNNYRAAEALEEARADLLRLKAAAKRKG